MRYSARSIVSIWLLFLILSCTPSSSDGGKLHLARRTHPAEGEPFRHESSLPLDSSQLSRGQLIYAPIYSELLFFDEKIEKLTAANMSIRNVSTRDSIRITFVDYYDDHGKLLRNYLREPVTLGPLGSTTFTIDQSDRSAGAGANFLLEWTARQAVLPPIVETITMQYVGQRALAFRSPSRVLRDDVFRPLR